METPKESPEQRLLYLIERNLNGQVSTTIFSRKYRAFELRHKNNEHYFITFGHKHEGIVYKITLIITEQLDEPTSCISTKTKSESPSVIPKEVCQFAKSMQNIETLIAAIEGQIQKTPQTPASLPPLTIKDEIETILS